MVMEHDIYFSKKENCFCNICTSHSYEIMTEFYPNIGELFYSLREVDSLMEGEELPPLKDGEYQKRLDELQKEGFSLGKVNGKFSHFLAKPMKRNYRNICKAYKMQYKNVKE